MPNNSRRLLEFLIRLRTISVEWIDLLLERSTSPLIDLGALKVYGTIRARTICAPWTRPIIKPSLWFRATSENVLTCFHAMNQRFTHSFSSLIFRSHIIVTIFSYICVFLFTPSPVVAREKRNIALTFFTAQFRGKFQSQAFFALFSIAIWDDVFCSLFTTQYGTFRQTIAS